VSADRKGRVEIGLGKEFMDRPDIGHSERAALRAQARAVDLAEALHDPDMVSRANAVYLSCRQAAGLVAGSGPVADSFGELLAELGRPGPVVRDGAH
jgi:hypothetical protein